VANLTGPNLPRGYLQKAPRGYLQKVLAAELARLEVQLVDLDDLHDTLGGVLDYLARRGSYDELPARVGLRAARADARIACTRLEAAATAIAAALEQPRRPLP
jgi:hypothetical protein